MKNYFLFKPTSLKIYFLILGLGITYSCHNDNGMSSQEETSDEKVVVANRASSSISFIDAVTHKVAKTLSIPGSDPMYVVYVPKTDKLYVGDRAGKKIHIVNPQNQQIESSITVGNGIFHMWADGLGKELWVVNDIDKTISVINLSSNTVTKTIDVGITPHDVFLSQDGTKAFVSVFTSDPNSDKVFSYSTSTYAKNGEITVGKEPHLFQLPNNKLYIPCQSGKLFIADSNTLNIISEKNYAGAHGIFASPDQNTLFVSNISGNQLYSINSATGNQIGAALSSPVSTPHNITVNAKGDQVFVSHSGASANTVSIYTANSAGNLTYNSSVTAGTNPFGITYYKRQNKF